MWKKSQSPAWLHNYRLTSRLTRTKYDAFLHLLCNTHLTKSFDRFQDYKYWWLMPLYWFFISHTRLMMVFCRAHTVVHTIFCLGSCLVGVGLMWTWSLFLHWSRIDEFVFGLKSVDELCQSPPMGISSADTSQPPKREICMDKSH